MAIKQNVPRNRRTSDIRQCQPNLRAVDKLRRRPVQAVLRQPLATVLQHL